MAVSLRLPDDLNIRLSNLADKTGRSKTHPFQGVWKETIVVS